MMYVNIANCYRMCLRRDRTEAELKVGRPSLYRLTNRRQVPRTKPIWRMILLRLSKSSRM